MQAKHWALLAAFMTGLGAQLSTITDWNAVLTPVFVGALFIQVASMIGAIFADKPTGKGTPPAASVLLVVALLAGVGVSTTGCHLWVKTATPATEKAAKQEVITALDHIRRAGEIVAATQDIEVAAHRAGLVSEADHKAVEGIYEAVGRAVLDGIRTLEDATKTGGNRQAAVNEILNCFDRATKDGGSLSKIGSAEQRATVRAGLLAARIPIQLALALL